MESTQNHADRIFSTKLWPFSENERSRMVEHMINGLTSESFSRRHSIFSKEKAGEYVKKIEDLAFAAANDYASKYPNAGGGSTAQVYEKAANKLFLDFLEQGPPAETESPNVSEAFPGIVEDRESVFDISTEERELLDTDLAIKLFMPLKELKNSCTKICFGNKSFGVEAALVAEGVLMGVQKTLKDVELVDFFFERSAGEALQVISIFSSALKGCVLRSLSLELGELGEEGLSAFSPLLKSQKMLEELKFINTNIYGEAARAICEFLPSIERIKCLHFSDNASGDDAAETLSVLVKKCIDLEDFEFSRSYIGTRGAKALAKALSEGSRLKTLNLKDNMFGTIGGVDLSQVIHRHLGLTEVYFDCMDLEDEGAIAIADSLKNAAPALRVLTVGGNDITPKAAPALAACLAVKNLLTLFCARDNMLKDDGLVTICKAISEGHEQLKELDLSFNGMTIEGALAAANAVANKPNLSGLFITDDSITEEDLEIVRGVLKNGTDDVSILWHTTPFNWRCIWRDASGSDSNSDPESEEILRNPRVRRRSEVSLRVETP